MGAHLKPVEHVCDAEAHALGVVNRVRVQLVSKRDPVHDDHIGLRLPLNHGRDQLVHPFLKQPAHLGKFENHEIIPHSFHGVVYGYLSDHYSMSRDAAKLV